MARQAGMEDSVLHVQTDLSGRTPLPVQGIADSDSHRAKLSVCDSGIETFPDTRATDDGATRIGFLRLSLGAVRTQSLDEWLTDAATAAGTLASFDESVSIVAKRSFLLKADSTNTGTVFVGDQATDGASNVGFPLSAGESLTLEITRGSNIFLEPSAATQLLHWIAV